jgi:hypothetical protein
VARTSDHLGNVASCAKLCSSLFRKIPFVKRLRFPKDSKNRLSVAPSASFRSSA